MEKLIKLLNEYEKSITEIPVYWWQTNGMFQYWSYIQQVSVMYMISKHYGFIKRLVDNDKIDLDKVKKICIKHNGRMDIDGLHRYSVYERVLMLLAIQDEPIEFLISILK